MVKVHQNPSKLQRRVLRSLQKAGARPGAWLATAGLAAGVVLARLPLLPALVAVAAVGLVILILIMPAAGIVVMLVAGPVGAWESLFIGDTLFDSGQILLFLTVAAWLLRSAARRRIRIPRTELDLLLLLFVGVALLSLADAPSLNMGLVELLKWIEIAVVVWMCVDLFSLSGPAERRRAIWTLVTFLLAAALLQFAVGLWQFVLLGRGPDHFLIRGRLYRAFGTFGQPNPYGGYMALNAALALGALLGLFMVFWQRFTAGKKHLRTDLLRTLGPPLVVAGTAALFCTAGLLMSWSRGAWLGMAAGSTMFALFWSRRLWPGLLLVALLMAGVAAAWQQELIPAPVASRLGGWVAYFELDPELIQEDTELFAENYPILERLAHWEAALGMIEDQFWSGVGFGNYAAAYPDYALDFWPNPLGHAHNYYLNIFAETGVFGFLTYLLFWLAVLWQTVRVIQRSSWPFRGLAIGLLAAWIALAVHHLLDKLYVNNIYVHLGVMLALLQILAVDVDAQRADGGAKRLPAPAAPPRSGS